MSFIIQKWSLTLLSVSIFPPQLSSPLSYLKESFSQECEEREKNENEFNSREKYLRSELAGLHQQVWYWSPRHHNYLDFFNFSMFLFSLFISLFNDYFGMCNWSFIPATRIPPVAGRRIQLQRSFFDFSVFVDFCFDLYTKLYDVTLVNEVCKVAVSNSYECQISHQVFWN